VLGYRGSLSVGLVLALFLTMIFFTSYSTPAVAQGSTTTVTTTVTTTITVTATSTKTVNSTTTLVSTATLTSVSTTTVFTQNETELNSLRNAVSTLSQRMDQLSANQSMFSSLTVIAIVGVGAVLVVIILFRSKGKRGTRTDNWDLFD
jgi:hypothetical protein